MQMNILDCIEKEIISMKELAPKYEIYFVVNVLGKTSIMDYKHTTQSILTEYLTEDEYNTMIVALKKSGFKVKIFNNEIDFIIYVIENLSKLDYEHIIVFNLARNGKGLNKKALIPAFCQLVGLKITGSDAYHVCLGRHKYHVNCILGSQNIPVPKTWCYSEGEWLLNEVPSSDIKLIVKPAFESASRGINDTSIGYYPDSLEDIIYNLQKEFEQDILVQEFISGFEVQVPVIKTNGKYKALMAVGISMNGNTALNNKIIAYEIAYDETYSFYDFSMVNKSLAQNLMNTAELACSIIGLNNYGRFDFRIDYNNNYYITDISTHPFLIKHSAFAYMFSTLKLKYEDIFLLLTKLVIDDKILYPKNK